MYTALLLIPWFQLHGWHLFNIGDTPVDIQPFGILVALGIGVGSRVAELRAIKTGVDPQLIADFLLYTIVIGGISAMVLNVLFYDQDRGIQILKAIAGWLHLGPHVKFPYPGLSSFGGFIGGVGAAFLFRHKKQATITVMGDLFCFAFPFAWFFGRMGCFVVHDHPGLVSHFFLAVDDYNGEGLPRHDLGFYEVIWSAVAVSLNLWLGSTPKPRGFFMAFIPIFYAPVRFGLDFLREIPLRGGDERYFGFTPGQYGAVLMLVAGVLVALRVKRGPEATIYLDGTNAPPPSAAAAASVPSSSKSQPPKKKKRK